MDWFQLQYRRGAGNEYSANPELPGAARCPFSETETTRRSGWYTFTLTATAFLSAPHIGLPQDRPARMEFDNASVR
jgi:hypothetical protein